MASIAKIRYTNVIYENGNKRYNDEIFQFAGHNSAILLENGGGKTVFIQAALQAVLPHLELGERKVKETFLLEGEVAHIGIEWILSDKPRRYALTAVTLYLQNNQLSSYKYAYEYGPEDKHDLLHLPFVQKGQAGVIRPSGKAEMADYYQMMDREYATAKAFTTTKEFHAYIEEQFKIVPDEWRSIALINGEEGGVDAFFEGCKLTRHLVENLLIPVVEQALAGKGGEDFAKTFESQREHFKKHKQLQESIDDSKKIKAQIEEYVSVYSEYDQHLKNYENKKSEAKTLWQILEKEQDKQQKEILATQEGQKECHEQKELLKKLDRLCQITDQKNHFEKLQEQYLDVNDQWTQKKQKEKKKEARLLSIKASRLKKNIALSEAKITVLKEKLALLDQNKEVQTLKEDLDENARCLKGYYEAELTQLHQKQQVSSQQKEAYLKQKTALIQQRDQKQEDHQKLHSELDRLEGKIIGIDGEMSKIKKEILANPENESIEQENTKWQQRIATLEEELVRLYHELKVLEEERLSLLEQLHLNREKYQQLLKEESMLHEKLTHIGESQDILTNEIKKQIPSLYHLETIYTKAQQVISTLEEGIERFAKEKEEDLLSERRLSRFIENYEEHSYFTAEPLLEIWEEKWRGEVSFLETGTRFIERYAKEGNKDLTTYYKNNSSWTQLLITADGKQEMIQNKINEQRDRLSCPVGVLSLTEARQMLQGEKQSTQDTLIYPTLWEKNLASDYFKKSKEEAKNNLDQATVKRKEKERKITQYQELLSKTKDFLIRYPHDEYLKLRTQKDQIKQELLHLDRLIKSQSDRQEAIQKEKDEKNKKEKRSTEELSKLEIKVQRALAYIQYHQVKVNHKKEQAHLAEMLEEITKTIQKQTKGIQELEEQLAEISQELQKLQNNQNRILEDKLYKSVKEEEVTYSTDSFEYLKNKREMLENALNERQENRQALERELHSEQTHQEENLKTLELEIGAMSDEIEQIAFTEELEAELIALRSELTQLKRELNYQQELLIKAKEDSDKAYALYKANEERFIADYNKIEKLDLPTELVRQDIKEKSQKLEAKEKYLLSRYNQLLKTLKTIEEQQRQLIIKDETHKYLAESVKGTLIAQELQQELTYHLERYVKELLEALEQIKEAVQKSKEKVYEQKRHFKNFCEEEIGDAKLKNMAIQGISQKETYEEILKWQDNMVSRINTTLNILENDMAQKDKQIAQFIIYLYSYLKTIAKELDEIPKKTRIKLEDGWKKIYEFDIPKWQEEEGKAKLREYIYRLLDELDKQDFVNEQGVEDMQKLRKYIKEQFQIKQLMKVVMGHDAISIKCRKVSSINSISEQKFSWETSTKWSGGEKWSKNMALFLGILNYLAEKRQHIQTGNAKITRSVILDNPFGKASSEHVLEPVFFIAEQLGFQIIALTAHSEGDFIRNYFPIVYSCRLRLAADRSTSIFSKQQEVKKAFFMDHDPTVLTSLSEVKQISLF